MIKHEALSIVAGLCADGVLDAKEEAILRKALAFPQRTWVGLADKEISTASKHFTEWEGFMHGAYWAQEKLKEKNT